LRAIAVLLLFFGFGCAVAQDSAPPPASNNAPTSARAPSASAPADPRAAWLVASLFGGAPGAFVVHYNRQGRTEFTGRPTGVCSVRLLEMPLPKDVGFTVRKFHPPSTGDRPYAEVPAPPCPEESH
jgi:hypothetical protein